MAEKQYNLNLETTGLGKHVCNVYRGNFRSKALDAIFGRKNRLLIIVPESCVTGLSITDASTEEKGVADEE